MFTSIQHGPVYDYVFSRLSHSIKCSNFSHIIPFDISFRSEIFSVYYLRNQAVWAISFGIEHAKLRHIQNSSLEHRFNLFSFLLLWYFLLFIYSASFFYYHFHSLITFFRPIWPKTQNDETIQKNVQGVVLV